MKRIRLENIVKVFRGGPRAGSVPAVDNVSLTIEPGEFFFLLGPSGCGKTTLLRIIAGLTQPSSGQVWLGDRNVTDLAAQQRNTAMVFQNYALWPHMTVRQNVEFGPRMRGAPAAERRRQAADNLARVEMGPYAARRPNQLSGGQQQRVALARALAAQGDCLLLDEPLSNLDARLRLHMRHQLRHLVKSTGITAVYVTHDQKEALSMADRVAVMNAGKVVQIGRPEEVYNRPATKFVADFLGEANFVYGTIAGPAGSGIRVETSVGDLLADNCAGREPGRNVLCCVRPERIELFENRDANHFPPLDLGTDKELLARKMVSVPIFASLHATVAESVYLGEMRQYICDLPGGQRWKISVLAGAEKAIPPGAPVALHVAAQDVALLPA
jgi:iron(III) transport system ATP-binding protein